MGRVQRENKEWTRLGKVKPLGSESVEIGSRIQFMRERQAWRHAEGGRGGRGRMFRSGGEGGGEERREKVRDRGL